MNENIIETVDQYIASLPTDRADVISQLRKVILAYLPEGFQEIINYGMIGYVVPHSIYPPGYHCNPQLPLPFLSIASQKNFIAIYHMGIYSDPSLLEWFVEEYSKFSKSKLDMGKSCIRFKNSGQIPYELIGNLIKKISVKEWIELYEKLHIKSLG